MISQQTIQQILNRTDIIEVVGHFVKLKKRGVNYLGLCPFHNEKSPSFTVSPSKEIYKCFGCGKSGNTISFLMEHEKHSYVDALKWLAAKYNVEIEETQSSPEALLQKQTAESLFIINEFARKFFTRNLLETEEGQIAGLAYLKERGFTDAIIEKFQLGFSPSGKDPFAREALQAQYNKDLLLKTGIVVERNGALIDNYRERIIFPIHNPSGKLVGFGARIIGKKENAPKYINTPENEIYNKSKLLYGSYFARHAIDREDECLLVEGYTDVIALHQAGIENVMASGGTSLTPDQLRLIRKYTNNLTILYDGDAAGIKAALRGLDLALEEGLNVQLVLLPDQEDPDSYVHKVGAANFRAYIASSKKEIILFQLEVLLKDAGNDSVKKASVVNSIAESISRIRKAEDFTRQQDYIKRSAELLRIDEAGLHTLVNKFIRERISKEAYQEKSSETTGEKTDAESGEESLDSIELLNKDEQNERALIRALLEFGLLPWTEEQSIAELILKEKDEWELVEHPELLQLFDLYHQWFQEGLEPDMKQFMYYEDQAISKIAVSLQDIRHQISPRWKNDPYSVVIPTRDEIYREEIKSVLIYLKLRKVKKMMEENQKDIEKNPEPEKLKNLLDTHLYIKRIEKELIQELGTVIVR
jgi:DNA primase